MDPIHEITDPAPTSIKKIQFFLFLIFHQKFKTQQYDISQVYNYLDWDVGHETKVYESKPAILNKILLLYQYRYA